MRAADRTDEQQKVDHASFLREGIERKAGEAAIVLLSPEFGRSRRTHGPIFQERTG
jgi:hypothetical protein